MTAQEVIDLAKRHGVRVSVHDDRLRLQSDEPPPPELVDLLRAHKAEVIALLTPDTPDSMPYFPPRIGWSAERGWLRVQDPHDGSWPEVLAKAATSGWVRLAMANKHAGGPA
jgi:hypothetical protein